MLVGVLTWLFISCILHFAIILFLDTFYIVSKELEIKGDNVKTFDDLVSWYDTLDVSQLTTKPTRFRSFRSYMIQFSKYIYLHFLSKQITWGM